MTISEGELLIIVPMTTAPSTRRIGRSVPFGGYKAAESPTSQIEVSVPSVQKLV